MRAEMSAAAQARVASTFTVELMAERAASLFERLAIGKGVLL
jgi:hypothetical protein